ncbi:coiled-coil domain-containing protein 174 [Cephus cinctus]|uniref:Coiled-coil domain-containing protein 174 n=1 Tax=Cephus cinctus TaxID=211228 RepID=A0AAJ7FS19_CEPCN|nr:coiled-coil domain-containing protein 174 [Cephus cinctus]
MNASKKINVNFSSLVGLKAELLRKQTEVNDAKAKNETVRTITKQPKVRTKKVKEEKPEKSNDLIIDIDDINAHKKSKLMLEAKSRLYERLKKNRNNTNPLFLVDFSNKSDESEEDPINQDDYDERTSDPEDDWIEYEDCFGRTRKCLRRDLQQMRDKDELVKDAVMKKPHNETDSKKEQEQPYSNIVVQETEPEIEIMRRKWEEQTEKLADKTDIHYQDVLFDEARAHGVGYYAFSQDEEQRAKQQENLTKLRKETMQKQKEMQEMKELRNKMEVNRLKVARIRQRIRAGLPAEPTEEETKQELAEKKANDKNETTSVANTENNDDEKKNVDTKDNSNKRDVEEDSLITIENKIKAFGELLGKRTHWYEMSQEEWVNMRRKDRLDEFAPSYKMFKSAGYLEGKREKEINDIDNINDIVETVGADTRSISPNIKSEMKIPGPHNISIEQSIPQPIVPNSDAHTDSDEQSDTNNSDIIGPLPATMIDQQIQNIVSKNIPVNYFNSEQSGHPDSSESLMMPLPGAYLSPPPSIPCLNISPEIPLPVPPPSAIEYSQVTLSNILHTIPPSITTLSMNNENHHIGTEEDHNSEKNINPETIAAGLKYLREVFEGKKKT